MKDNLSYEELQKSFILLHYIILSGQNSIPKEKVWIFITFSYKQKKLLLLKKSK